MRKIPTLFVREFLPNHKIIITDQVAPGCEWVLAGEGVATASWTAPAPWSQDGYLYKRYDAKNGKPIPPNAIPCQPEADPITGHLPCWMPVSETDPGDKWFVATFKSVGPLADGTYELCGRTSTPTGRNWTTMPSSATATSSWRACPATSMASVPIWRCIISKVSSSIAGMVRCARSNGATSASAGVNGKGVQHEDFDWRRTHLP